MKHVTRNGVLAGGGRNRLASAAPAGWLDDAGYDTAVDLRTGVRCVRGVVQPAPGGDSSPAPADDFDARFDQLYQ